MRRATTIRNVLGLSRQTGLRDAMGKRTIMERACEAIAARRPRKIIWAESRPDTAAQSILFYRYFLCQLPRWMGGHVVYLHEYMRSDPDRGMHDHPWNSAIALPLVRGYTEQRFCGFSDHGPRSKMIERKPFRPYRLTGSDFHRVVMDDGAKPSWSIFAHGPWTKVWGFLRREIGLRKPGMAVAHFGYYVAGDEDNEPPQWWKHSAYAAPKPHKAWRHNGEPRAVSPMVKR
jgi:hypothetical protein